MRLFRPLAASSFAALLGFQAAVMARAQSRAPAPAKVDRPDLVFVQAPQVRPGQLSARYPQGSRIVRLDAQSASPINLTPQFFAAADPQVSFDGNQVLFAAKREAAASWQIWEMRSDGSAPRQLTHCSGDCLRPAYLPRDEIVFTAEDPGPAGRVSQLYVSKREGTEAHPITFGPGEFRVETVLANGLIMASARSPLLPRTGQENGRDLYTIRPDGSGLAAFRCDHQPSVIREDAAELEDGSVVLVKSHNPVGKVAGELTIIRRGALHNSPLATPAAFAASPRGISMDRLVVARPPAGQPGSEKLGLYAFDSKRGGFSGLIFNDPRLSSLAAVPVAAHAAPKWYWSTLNPALQVGYFICLNSYRAEGAPQGRLAVSLFKVRVLSLDPRSNQEHSLGEAPIEKDGSFYLAVPPDVPVRFELLDEGGRVVRAQRSWIWSRSGEEHGCVGCHEDRALAPENRWPMTLRRFDTPTRLGVPAVQAARGSKQ